jgi:hypothetical protein
MQTWHKICHQHHTQHWRVWRSLSWTKITQSFTNKNPKQYASYQR